MCLYKHDARHCTEKVDMAKLYSLCAGSFALDKRKVLSNYFKIGENYHIHGLLGRKTTLNCKVLYQNLSLKIIT